MSEKVMKCPRCRNMMVVVDRDELQRDWPNAYKRWTREEDQTLSEMYRTGEAIMSIAQSLGRPPNTIVKRAEYAHKLFRPLEGTQERPARVEGEPYWTDPKTGQEHLLRAPDPNDYERTGPEYSLTQHMPPQARVPNIELVPDGES